MTIAGLEVGLPKTLDDVTAEWLTRVLRRSGAIDESTTVASLVAEPFQVGVGLVGKLARLELTYDGGSGPASLVVKYPIDIESQLAMAHAMNFYAREVRFYTELAAVSDLRTAQVHASMIDDDQHFMIVMEDLSHLRQGDRINGMTWDEAEAAVRALARFHAGWHESDRLDELSECWLAVDNPLYSVVLPQIFTAGWGSCQENAADLLTDEVIAFGNDFNDLMPAAQARFMTAPTLIHADYRADNLFVDDNGDIVTVDFQIAGVGNGVYDLAYFVSQSLEPEVRRGRERELIQLYIDTLATHGVHRDPEVVWVDFQVALAFFLLYGVASFVEFGNLPGEGQSVLTTLLRRCVSAIVDTDAITAYRALT